MLLNTFTYRDYLKSIHTIRLNAVLEVAESGEKYRVFNENINSKRLNKTQSKIQNTHDKLVKNILKDRKEMANFINQFLNPKEKVNSDELVKYTNSYINKKYKLKEADIVYKLKNKDIFFLVEHQSTVDYNMSYRILNYCVEIMQDWIRGKSVRKVTRYPIVVPIVIYTGKEKWNVERNFQDKQMQETTYGEHRINLKYNIVDINKCDNRFLLGQKTLFGYGMLIEKSKDKKELIESIEKIIKQVDNEDIFDELARIIIYLLDSNLENNDSEELLNKIYLKVGEMEMKNTLVERIREENQQIRKEARLEVVRNMIVKNVDEKIIVEVAEISKEELEKIKRKMKVQRPIL